MNQSVKGVIWVAGVYFYFLIFAQFAFLELLSARMLDASGLKLVMALMALGGIAGSFSVLRLLKRFEWSALMRVSAGMSGAMSLFAAAGLSIGVGGYTVLAFGIGFSLGVLTVLLASHLPGYLR